MFRRRYGCFRRGRAGNARLSSNTKILLIALVVSSFGLRLWYASYDLNQKRFWDERNALANVRSFLTSGSLEPARIYYPSPLTFVPAAALLAASEKLYEVTDVECLRVGSADRFTRTSFALARLTSVVYGTLAVFLLFVVGRRAFGTGVGLAAAVVLAFLPAHIRASGMFKPDALLTLAVLLAFYCMWVAVRNPRPGRYLIAASAIALALSAKLTGGVVALSLLVGTAAMNWKDRRRWGLLVLAAAASVIIFLALNPYGWHYLAYTEQVQEAYARRAAARQMTSSQMPQHILEFFVGPGVHGPWFGGLVAIGALGMLVETVRSKRDSEGRAFAFMLLAFPLAYSAAYAVVTPYFKPNNFVPVTPFTCLIGAWAAVRVGEWIRRKFWSGGSALFPAAAAGAFFAVVVLPGPLFVYRSLTPTTFDRAEELIHSWRPDDLRRYRYEEYWSRPIFRWERRLAKRKRAEAVVVEQLSTEPRSALQLADGVVFLHRRLEGENKAFYESLLEGDDHKWVQLQPNLFELRGPALVVVTHHWMTDGGSVKIAREPCTGQPDDCWRILVPEKYSRGVVSLTIRLSKRSSSDSVRVAARIGSQSVGVSRLAARPWLLRTERFSLRSRQLEVRGPGLGAASESKLDINLQEWNSHESE